MELDHQSWRTVALVAVSLGATLSGCAGPEPTDAAQASAASAGAPGTIRGLVVDEAVTPLTGVTVQLDDGARNATTDAGGLFAFEDVPAGAHRLRAQLPGFLPTLLETELAPGETTPILRLVVQAESTTAPYAETLKWEGIIQCAVSVAGDGGNCAPAVFADEFAETYQFAGRPDWVQSELVWESTQLLGESMSIEFWCNRGPPCPDDSLLILGAAGPSPQTLILERGLVDKWQVGDPDQFLYIRVDGRSTDETQPEVVLSQSFTVYTTVFYNIVPPQGWTFVTDGAPPV